MFLQLSWEILNFHLVFEEIDSIIGVYHGFITELQDFSAHVFSDISKTTISKILRFREALLQQWFCISCTIPSYLVSPKLEITGLGSMGTAENPKTMQTMLAK